MLQSYYPDNNKKSSGDYRTANYKNHYTRRTQMKQSTYNNFDDLPLFLNAETAAALLGVSISSMYELMHEKGFPVLRVGSRLVIPKDKLRAWVEQNTGK